MTDVLIIQTAFAGDLILTTPLISETARTIPDAAIDVICIPSTAPLLENNPAVRDRIVYDKHGGKPPLTALMRTLAGRKYNLCLVPHRSFRSAVLARATGAPRRVSFDRSSAAMLYTETVPYRQGVHEVRRNLSLLQACGVSVDSDARPVLYPSESDAASAAGLRQDAARPAICIAPGSVWATKRWTEQGFAEIARQFVSSHEIMFIGGKADAELCDRIIAMSEVRAVNTAGKLSLLASAALIASSSLLVSNDSAPVHLASATGTPVVELYGATVPGFGFTPFRVPHRIVQREDLKCRPCGIHGGDQCPIETFECMRALQAENVVTAMHELLAETA